ncbi:hypothetical protein STANM337S_02391 [Streptomyces tanashiensis]
MPVSSEVGPRTASTEGSVVSRRAAARAPVRSPRSSETLSSRVKGLPLWTALNRSTASRAPRSWARPISRAGPERSARTPMAQVFRGLGAGCFPSAPVSSRRSSRAKAPPPAAITAAPAPSSRKPRLLVLAGAAGSVPGAVASMSGSASMAAERSAMVVTTGAGSQSAEVPGMPSVSRSAISSAAGRSAGFLARHAARSGSRSSGTPARSGSSWTVRYMRASTAPEPKGGRPVVAYARRQPRAKTSAGGPMASVRASACSGARKPGVPTTMSVAVSAVSPVARAMPKSMRRGPSTARRTLPGLTSRWTSPAACTAARARATAPQRIRTLRSGSGPWARTASPREGPGTKAVAIHGSGASGSAPVTGTAQGLTTRRAASTSRRKRARKSGWSAWSAWVTLTAASSPLSVRPR